ncbi:hypothetical protein J562_4471, partial [Acinetobacter baumannii 1440750]
MPVFSTHFKSDGIFISFYIQQKIILSGITMPNLEASFRALRVLHTARD